MPINVNGSLICSYVADFTYTDNKTEKLVVEDVKGYRTDVFKIKKKLVEATYKPLKIIEVRA